VRTDTTGKPVCTLIGGPNGSGKSTIYDIITFPGRFVNADLVARGINPAQPEAVSMAAGRQTLAELERLIGARESFVYETTLSSRQSVELMRKAKTANYEVGLVFVMLTSANLHIRRVAERVSRGGHHIPEDTVRRRYESALSRLPEAIRLADGATLYDNSTDTGPHLLVRIQAGVIETNNLDAADPFHRRFAEAVSEALAISTDAVFKTARPG
jgi:predicted ABC-type ATPase